MVYPGDDKVINALKATFGNQTKTAALLGVARATVNRWLQNKKYPQLREAVLEIRESNCDAMEDMLLTLGKGIPETKKLEIKDDDGNVTRTDVIIVGWKERPDRLCIFGYLNAHAKDRGYTRKFNSQADKEFTITLNKRIVNRDNVAEVSGNVEPESDSQDA